jgi:hypothetical protein
MEVRILGLFCVGLDQETKVSIIFWHPCGTKKKLAPLLEHQRSLLCSVTSGVLYLYIIQEIPQHENFLGPESFSMTVY